MALVNSTLRRSLSQLFLSRGFLAAGTTAACQATLFPDISRALSGADAAPSGRGFTLPPRSRPLATAASTVNPREAKKFASLAEEWWAPNGAFAALHRLNPTRCRFIRAALCDNYALNNRIDAPLVGLKILDVGCGGGILSEALARMGASVDGIDVNPEGLAVAEQHAALDPTLDGNLRYRATTVEAVAAAGEQYDAVIASEVIEHVASVPAFCTALVEATAPGGAVVVSTLNRTLKSYALAVVAAERILRWAEPGTHEWDKFLSPEELAMAMEVAGSVSLEQAAGMIFNPLSGQWGLGSDLDINYICYFKKK